MSKSVIVSVPLKMEKYYGKGKMLHPSREDVEACIQKIPYGKLTTLKEIENQLSRLYGTDVACPMRTGNILKKIANENASFKLPFWRVIRSNGLLINIQFP